jgi:hypothetical protein
VLATTRNRGRKNTTQNRIGAKEGGKRKSSKKSRKNRADSEEGRTLFDRVKACYIIVE